MELLSKILKWLGNILGNYYQKRDDKALDYFLNQLKENDIKANSLEYKKLYRKFFDYSNHGLSDDEICDINIEVERYTIFKVKKFGQENLANWWRQSSFTYLLFKKKILKFIFQN